MMHRICEAVAPAKNDPIEGADKAVEVDETWAISALLLTLKELSIPMAHRTTNSRRKIMNY
jgi:hypothetical protein